MRILSIIPFFVLAACSSDDKKDNTPTDTPVIAEGTYYMKSGVYEGADNQGNRLAPQNLTVTGEYSWTFKYLGNKKYELIGTGSANYSQNGQTIQGPNCKGSRDVYIFELTDSKNIRGMKPIETGCPQGVNDFAANQLSVDIISNGRLIFTIVTDANGQRSTISMTFAKD